LLQSEQARAVFLTVTARYLSEISSDELMVFMAFAVWLLVYAIVEEARLLQILPT
jgi:hypothetical protein